MMSLVILYEPLNRRTQPFSSEAMAVGGVIRAPTSGEPT
jgi:hypothetical protein